MLTMYAVRHIPTGRFLPTGKTGFTKMDPMEATVVPPRLHISHRRANAAMHAWCRGHYIAQWDWWSSDDCYSAAGGPYVEDIKIKPVTGRFLEHMEVVEIVLNVR